LNVRPDDVNQDLLNQEVERQLAGMTAEDMERAAAGKPHENPRDERGRVHGRITAVRGDDVLVDMGGKSEAFLSINEFDPHTPPEVGQEHWFVMHGLDRDSGLMRLSLKAASAHTEASALKAGDLVEGRVTGVNIGGLELAIHQIRAFMPKSQVELHRVEDFTPYIGRRLDCEVTEVDRKGKRVVVSRRLLLEKQQQELRAQLQQELHAGDVRPGIVRRLTNFGAFVDIGGGVEGLLHISDMSYGRLKHAQDLLKEGQQIEVKILKIEPERDRISLGMKQLEADPWESAPARYQVGAVIEGRVAKLADFGAFVELEPGIEGLIPISEMSYTQRVRHPRDILKEGDGVRVSIMLVDPDKHKVTLSLRALTQDPWIGIGQRYTPDSEVSGAVTRIVEFGAFVQLEDGVEGLVHISEMSEKRIRTPGDVVKSGDVVKVRIKSVDPEARRISLSMRAPAPAGAAVAGHEHAGHGHGGDHGHAAHAPAAPSRADKKRLKKLKGGLDR
jgi:small subunit ribosomal protein S1